MNGLIRTVAAVALAVAGMAGLLANHSADSGPDPAGDPVSVADAAVLTPAQIVGFAHGAGFRGDGLTVAVAMALAESSGNPRAHNAVAPDDSYGLWQINMLGELGPDRRARYGLGSNRELFDPAVNAKVAYAVSDSGRNWTPWSTYTHGTYRRFLDEAGQGVGAWQAGAR